MTLSGLGVISIKCELSSIGRRLARKIRAIFEFMRFEMDAKFVTITITFEEYRFFAFFLRIFGENTHIAHIKADSFTRQ